MFESTHKYAFKDLAVLIGGSNLILSDGHNIFILEQKSKLVRLEFDIKLEIRSLKSSEKQLYIYTPDKLYMIDLSTDSYKLMQNRFSPRIVYDIAERGMNLDKIISFDYHGDHYIYCTSQSEVKSRIMLINKQGFELYVKDPTASLTIKLQTSA